MEQSVPHRRQNLLTGEWVLVSPQRVERPWLGKVERIERHSLPTYALDCYLCPGNTRANGATNPNYKTTFVFENDFPALLPQLATRDENRESHLLRVNGVAGACRVLCFSPRHDIRLAEMDIAEIVHVVDAWAQQDVELGREYVWVQIFENNGEMMGCSNPHPHGQIWATSSIPNEPLKEDLQQRHYFSANGSPLLHDYIQAEVEIGERLVVGNEDWLVLVPFWAVWPFETILLPKVQIKRLQELRRDQRTSLARILKTLLTKYDNLLATDFPYSMGWHGAPHRDKDEQHWWLHAHFYPPLLRSATVKKFLVGYEMLSEPQRDITPEQAAERLRQTSE